MQFQVCESDDSCQPGAQYTNPRVVVQEHHGAPLLNCSGLVLVRQLIERLGVASAIDAGVRVLRRCKWYRESDHILTLIYSMISGGSRLQDVNRLGQDDALKRVLGSDRIPHATTIGKFLWRFGDDQQDKQRQGLAELRDTTAAVQQEAFGMLPRERRKVATLDWDSSIHEVYGQKKEGADFAYDNTWSYSALYGTLAETGDVLYLGLREGYRHTSYGTKEVLPGTIERVSKHFRQVRMRADSGYYSQALVKICEQRGVEFFIVAKQHRNLMNAVREIQDSNWKSFAGSDLQAGDRRRRRRRRANLKRKIAIRRKPNSRFKGAPEVAGMMFKPKSWNKARRYVIKRTPIVDKDDQQLYLDDGLRQYVYWIVVSNSKRSNEQRAPLFVMKSSGSVMSARAAGRRAVETVMSGPAGGLVAGAAIARSAAGSRNLITADMGGTSFDVGVVHGGEVAFARDTEMGGLAISVPMLDIHSVGAGGGSIGWIDAGGALRVGPRSAGARPGPACYGTGGSEPTVTDANLVLGRLGAQSLLGGGMAVDPEAARRAIGRRAASTAWPSTGPTNPTTSPP